MVIDKIDTRLIIAEQDSSKYKHTYVHCGGNWEMYGRKSPVKLTCPKCRKVFLANIVETKTVLMKNSEGVVKKSI